MFTFFKRRRTKSSVIHGVFQKMAIVVERQQRKAANYLNRKASGLSERQLLSGFICFTFLFAALAVYVVWEAFQQPAYTVSVKAIAVPRHVIVPETERDVKKQLSRGEIKRIQSFRAYLDSLQQTTKGKQTFDSIARHRPGLIDSLIFIEQLYHEQLKLSEDGKKK